MSTGALEYAMTITQNRPPTIASARSFATRYRNAAAHAPRYVNSANSVEASSLPIA